MVKNNEICRVYLIDRYVDCFYGMSKIIKELESVGIKTSVGYIYNLLKKHNIKIRGSSQAATIRTGTFLDHDKTFLDEQMIEWIDGFLLGDGCITPSNQTARAHTGVLYKDFCDYMRSGFTNYSPRESYFSKPTGEAIKKGGKGTWGFATLSHPDLRKQYLRWYIKKDINDIYGIKEPPDDVRITPISVMLWYLGDGYLAIRENAKCVFIRLSTDSFSPDKIENILVKKLKEKNIDCYRNNDNRIVITPQGLKPFFDFIGKNPVKEYQYKFDLPSWSSIESKKMSVVAKELGITYNQLSYWVKFNYVPCLRASKISKPRFLPEHIEKIKEYIEYDKNNSKTDKTKKTNLIKYGVENVFQSEDIKEKIKQTNLERYGVESPLQNKDILQKSKKTNLLKYGVDNPLKNEYIKQKSIETNNKKYGCDNAQQNKEIKDKTVETFNQTIKTDPNNNYKLINTLRKDEFWKMLSEEKMYLKDVCKYFDIEYQSVTSRLLSDEFKDKYYSLYSFPTLQKQKEIQKIIEDWGFKVEFNNRSIISPLELDIYIPDKKFAIEFNGSYWHSEACLEYKDALYKHYNKTKQCNEKGIRLFHIFEHQWESKKDQILGFIKTILGKNEIKIGARECLVNNDNSKDFINKYHIQGYGKTTIKYFNLIYNNEIVASMTASKHHRQNTSKDAVILNRLCFKEGVSVQGGSSKLFKYFIEWAKQEGYSKIISWSNSSWTNGDIYKILDFELIKEYKPDYFYYDIKNRKYLSKQSQKKSNNGCPKDIKERDWCIDKGLFRIWDSGMKLWSYELSKK